MSKPPLDTRYLTLAALRKLFDPPRAFYRPAVEEVLLSGEFAKIQETIKGAREAKAEYGDFDGLIAKLESAAKKVQG